MEFLPAGNEPNALQRVVFIIEFKREFSNEDFKRIDENSVEWRQELPKRSVSNAVLIQPDSSRYAYDRNRIVGLSYEVLLRDGSPEFGLSFEGSRIFFLIGKYTRWRKIWPNAKKFLGAAMNLVPDDNPVVSFATEYTDLFRAKGKYDEIKASEILRSESRFIPSHVFNRNLNFHFYTGFFEEHKEPAAHRILTRVNADLRDNDEERSRDLTIVLFHQILSDREPWSEETELDDSIINRGLENFVSLHTIDRSVLGDILNDAMSKKIGL